MVILKIEIQNFRLYYKQNTFLFTNGLNLIIGGNGDGKTTFFDAVEWLIRTDGTNKMDTKFISKKRISELFSNDSDDVRVAMTYEHKGKVKTLEKGVRFTKSLDGEISTSNYTFSLVEGNGVERIIKDGTAFDKDIPSEMRRFIMFKGYVDLDVMQNSNSLKFLVDNFGEVQDFETYFAFMEYATKRADKAQENAQKLDKKNWEKINGYKHIIKEETGILSDIEREIKMKENEAIYFENLLKSIERDVESSKLLVSVNRRIETLFQKRSETIARIRENYTRNLIDENWILLGFDEIAKEYSAKVYEVACKCEKEPSLKHGYISELENQDVALYESYDEIADMRHKIQEAIAFNNRLHDEVKKLNIKLEDEYVQKKRLLAQTDGLTEEQLLANYDNISSWMEHKNRAENRIDSLKRKREENKAKLEEAQMALSKISEGTSAALYAKTALIIRQISEAFKNAKEINKRKWLCTLEEEANLFLKKLRDDNFCGTIRIVEKQNGQCESFLMDDDSMRIYCPGDSLRIAYLLSIMLAIGKINRMASHDELPLLFDAPVSYFDTEQGNNLFASLDCQTIILTRDYLNYNKVIDFEKLKNYPCTLYRIEKKRPFDSKRLSTLQVSVTRLQ